MPLSELETKLPSGVKKVATMCTTGMLYRQKVHETEGHRGIKCRCWTHSPVIICICTAQYQARSGCTHSLELPDTIAQLDTKFTWVLGRDTKIAWTAGIGRCGRGTFLTFRAGLSQSNRTLPPRDGWASPDLGQTPGGDEVDEGVPWVR